MAGRSEISFAVTTAEGLWRENVLIPRPAAGQAPTTAYCLTDNTDARPQLPQTERFEPVDLFIEEVNRKAGIFVVEVGARAVSENWSSLRDEFSDDIRYLGLDIHPGPNVDIVGDAHRVHELVGEDVVDATFSLSVMEHLAHPWIYAHSVNRALRIGGVTYQETHQTWALHGEPNDFWRFTDGALRLLFGPAMGFEVIAAGMVRPMRIHPAFVRSEDVRMPLVSAWGTSFILSRKVAHTSSDAAVWPVNRDGSSELARRYPKGR